MHPPGVKWISRELWEDLAAADTNAHRLANDRDGWLDRYGDYVMWSGVSPVSLAAVISGARESFGFVPLGVWQRQLVRASNDQRPAELVYGHDPGEFTVREGGVAYAVELAGGYSTGLFLDQRGNRQLLRERRPGRLLNLFAYTCSFSVVAARAGAETCSVDASKRALARGRANFALNGLAADDGRHRFVADDAVKVVTRLRRRGEVFDAIMLDPPTFGRASGRTFRLERDLPDLVAGCHALLSAGGHLMVSSNFRPWTPAILRRVIEDALRREKFRMMPGRSLPEISAGAISWWVSKV